MDLNAHEQRPKGALVFSCNGRGTRLFAEPHHDARAIRAEAGSIPLAGFFAAGELGPVGGQNFIHGFTASVVLFEE
jgi:small ligand-binding sensory domain FIST